MNILYRFLLSLSATSWMALIYVIRTEATIYGVPSWLLGVAIVVASLAVSLLTVALSKAFPTEKLLSCKEIELADNNFLPTYLGFFFVSLSINSDCVFIVVYAIVFLFSFLSQSQYYNPLYLLFGFHFYNVITPGEAKVLVIARGKILKNAAAVSSLIVQRINNTTFIQRWGKEHESSSR